MRYKKGRQFGKCFEVFFMGGRVACQHKILILIFFFLQFLSMHSFLTLMTAFEINENPGMLM